MSKIASKTISTCQEVRIAGKVSELSKICKYEISYSNVWDIGEHFLDLSYLGNVFLIFYKNKSETWGARERFFKV